MSYQKAISPISNSLDPYNLSTSKRVDYIFNTFNTRMIEMQLRYLEYDYINEIIVIKFNK